MASPDRDGTVEASERSATTADCKSSAGLGTEEPAKASVAPATTVAPSTRLPWSRSEPTRAPSTLERTAALASFLKEADGARPAIVAVMSAAKTMWMTVWSGAQT